MKPPLDRPVPLPHWAGVATSAGAGSAQGPAWYKRSGARVETFTWLEDWFAHCFEPETIAKLAEAGFNLVTVPAFSGFGRRTEAAWLDRLPELVERCHSAGLRVLAGVELGGLCLETMPADGVPFESWLHRTPDGRLMHPRPEQYWRGLPDLTCDGFRDWLGGLLLELLQAGFDGVWLGDAEPRTVMPSPVAGWREFIAGYTDFYGRKCAIRPTRTSTPAVEVAGDPLCSTGSTIGSTASRRPSPTTTIASSPSIRTSDGHLRRVPGSPPVGRLPRACRWRASPESVVAGGRER